MATTIDTSTYNKTSSATSLINENGILDKDSFLKLLLTELQYQDPTSPMETDKMLSQTADLTVVESQQNMVDSMSEMTEAFIASAGYPLIASVGKIADTGLNAIKFNNGGEAYDIEMYFKEDFYGGSIKILDSNGAEIRSITVEDGSEGIQNINWDGKDDGGSLVEAGTYTIYAEYIDSATNEKLYSDMGELPIESVRFIGTAPELKVGGSYYTLSQIAEIKEK